ncbi:hypothetical protein FA95DRAFT_1604785 [Auriscalpium vulgare]|uniref:Uncharacterized protein n=1 Tax=Auriscalpium vulgare TaxID=40419 RepID=A0ACB8RZC8_9AGAM|nr:hypothetical protein FA95DRAFT_1604785 [Auriscalpium vulgare]
MPPSSPPAAATLLTLRGSTVARIHTVLSFVAFSSALLLGSALHFQKIVKNDVAGWPQEWFPSVSATIGDWYPERNLFQILIALTSGPRFALLALSHLLNRTASTSSLPAILLVTGIVRTLSCGGWVYITSSDDHDVHDVLMILYIACNIPWMWGGALLAQGKIRRRRILVASAFWLSLIPMVHFFVQHKVHRIPGAYTRYAFFEWSLIFTDVLYDSISEVQIRESNLQVTIEIPSMPNQAATRKDEEIEKAATTDSEPTASSPAPIAANNPVTSESSIKPADGSSGFYRLATARPFLSFASDVYFAYQSWTILTGLPVTLFYFSVWKLALAGPEFSSLATLAPLLLGIPEVMDWARTNGGRATLAGLASVTGVGLWWVESVWGRLAGVAVAAGCAAVKWAVEWESEERAYHAVVTLTGLLVSALSKHLNDGNNPAWPIVDEKSGGYHKPILVLALLALLELATRPASSSFPESVAPSPSTPAPSRKNPPSSSIPSPSEPWFLPGLALGALIYSLHERLADPSTLIAWSWTGYPVTGPHPHVHAGLTLFAQALGLTLGLLLSSSSRSTVVSPLTSSVRGQTQNTTSNLFTHPLVFALGHFSAYTLLTYTSWRGYFGGLAHAVFLMASAPHVIQQAGSAARARGAGRVFGVAWLTWIVFIFIGTFTVAYAFVPGAMPFREKTNLVLAAQLALLASSFSWRAVLSPFSLSQLPALPPLPVSTRKFTASTLVAILLAALAVPLARPLPPAPVPTARHSRARIVNAGIWTVHFGIDDSGRDSQRRVRDLVRDMELDVLGLLETDLHRPVFGGRDITRVLAQDLGYYVDIGPGPNKHTWGCALLSKFPILKSTHHLLPSPDGELAPAIEAILDVYGVNVTVVSLSEETPLDRELQATELARIMSASYPQPVIFLGYVVTKPHDERPAPYNIMVTDGRVYDIDEDDLDRWCEYILYRGLYRTAYARVSRSTITDTELQIGQFVVPRYGFTVGAASKEDRYLRAWKEDLPVEHWFPPEYYGDVQSGGVRGHFYHVFDTPLYYKIPAIAVL